MKKPILFLALVIMVIALGWGFWKRWMPENIPQKQKEKPSHDQASKIPEQALQAADKFIISRVGEAYFQERYNLERDSSEVTNNNEGRSYKVFYADNELSKILPGARVSVVLNDDFAPSPHNRPPACFMGGKVMPPLITKQKAHEILKEKGYANISEKETVQVQAGKISDPVTGCWDWEAYDRISSGSGCSKIRKVRVSMELGGVRDLGVSETCT